jgi:hypothetical protein
MDALSMIKPPATATPIVGSGATLSTQTAAQESFKKTISEITHGVQNQLGILLMGIGYLETQLGPSHRAAPLVLRDMVAATDQVNEFLRKLREVCHGDSMVTLEVPKQDS